jgi:uncharacterized protein YukE
MGEKIRIDTKYARRDLNRIKKAISQLKTAKDKYNGAINSLNNVYKGDASSYLQVEISTVKIKRIDAMITSLETAYSQLSTTITQCESANNKLTNTMKG